LKQLWRLIVKSIETRFNEFLKGRSIEDGEQGKEMVILASGEGGYGCRGNSRDAVESSGVELKISLRVEVLKEMNERFIIYSSKYYLFFTGFFTGFFNSFFTRFFNRSFLGSSGLRLFTEQFSDWLVFNYATFEFDWFRQFFNVS
jgi:hypothetical protein